MSTSASYEYDVAISFLSLDEPLALQVREALAPLRVFVYSKAQEEIAGREGIEAFREVFRDRARVALVLFRARWGQTPWTRVEETAIRDRCLEAGWDHLMFVRLEKAEKPKWVPDSYLHLDFQSFGMPDLVGAVKARCAKLGAELRPPNPAERAKRMAAEERYNLDTAMMLQSTPQHLYDAAGPLFAAIEKRLVEIGTNTGWTVIQGADAGREFVACTDPISMQLMSRWSHYPAEAYVQVQVVSGRIVTPQERAKGLSRLTIREPKDLAHRQLKLARAAEYGWCWECAGRTLSAEAAADLVLDEFVSARDRERRRQARGEQDWP